MVVGLVGAVPDPYTNDHVLVVPRGASLVPFAAAWFPGTAWVREPVAEDEVRRRARHSTGARFRGLVVETNAEPGVLALTDVFTAVGPFALDAQQLAALDVRLDAADGYALHAPAGGVERGGPASASDDRDGLVRAFADGFPLGEELQVLTWAVATARETGGALVTSTRTVLAPDPDAAVDMTLFSAQPLTSGELLPMMRKVVTGARLVSEATGRGPVDFALVGESAYDGDMHVWMQRVSEAPLALSALDWREYGPFAYRLSWQPTEGFELDMEHPPGTHVIARARMRSSIARLAEALVRRVGGTVVDDGGFVVRAESLAARVASETSGRLWV